MDPLRVGELEVVHEPDEGLFAPSLAQPRIEALLLRHRRHGAAAIVVPGIQQRVVRHAEDPVVNRLVERCGAALLKIGAAAAPDQECIAREGHPGLAKEVGHAAVGVSRRRANLEAVGSEVDDVAVVELHVRRRDTRARRDVNATTEALPEPARAGDVIRVDVGLEAGDQTKPELVDEPGVAAELLADRIDDDGVARRLVRQEVREGRGLGSKSCRKRSDMRAPSRSMIL